MKTLGNRPVDQRWNGLSSQRGELSDFELACIICGGTHLTQDHWEFMQTMPQDPIDMIDDLVKMGLYKSDQFAVADRVNQVELRQALFLKMAGKGSPKREKKNFFK